MSAYVEVNECKILATRSGADWWTLYRHRADQAGRVTVITPSIAGDLVRIACDDRDDAEFLAGHMVSHGGVPATAVRANGSIPGKWKPGRPQRIEGGDG